VVNRQIDRLSIPAEDAPCIANVGAVELVADEEHDYSRGAALLALVWEVLGV
jgi:hypothetical protein